MAAGFRFRLEVVRRIRKQAQDVQRREVADAVRSLSAVQDRLAALEGQLHVTVNQTRETQQAGLLDLMSLQRHHLYRGWLHRRRVEVREELVRHEEQLDERRARLAEATKQLKVVQKLREKQKTRYDRRMQRQEQAAYDEAALQIYRRGHSGRVREVGAL
jgi:flagellar FliJ protein